ncbi:MAG: hypothetical protein ACYTG5_00860 [Planctomycetota bacterium]|jgi:hypothetical protein
MIRFLPGILCAAGVLIPGLKAQVSNADADRASLTFPADYDRVDAPGVAFWFLTPFDSHHQILLDESQLSRARTSNLRSISVRRNAGDPDDSEAGVLWVEITLSHSSRSAANASENFADNRGGDDAIVFAGPVHLSSAEALDGEVPGWSGSDVLTIPFKLPFQYQGGTLCIETRTRPHADQSGAYDLPWWPIDALVQQANGSVEVRGESCITDLPGAPADAAAGSMVVGSTANFYLRGTRPLGASFCFIGDNDQTMFGVPLPITIQMLGPPCTIYMEPQSVIAVIPKNFFGPRGVDRVVANARMPIPGDASMIGKEMFSQWLVREPGLIPRYSLSNAVRVVLAGDSGPEGVAWIESMDPAAETGQIVSGRAPVLRFSH